jgi:hypothetical protein
MSPKRPEPDNKTVPLKTLVTPEEAKAVEEDAEDQDRSVSAWLRLAALEKLGRK